MSIDMINQFNSAIKTLNETVTNTGTATDASSSAAASTSTVRSYEDFLESKRNIAPELDKDAFFKILIAQLQNQNPLEPMEDTAFVAQMAQFTALEQMQSLNKSFEMSQGYSLIGKVVYASAMVDGIEQGIVDVVTSTFTKDGTTYITLGDIVVPLSSVEAVYDSSHLDGIGSVLSDKLLSSAGLIGMYAKATIELQEGTGEFDEDGKEITKPKQYEVMGKIDSVYVGEGGVLLAKINGRDIALNAISHVSSTPIETTLTEPPEETPEPEVPAEP